VAIGAKTLQAFPKAFDGLANLLRSQLDLMALVALVKRSRERPQMPPIFRNMLYYGVGLVYVRLLQKRAPACKKGFKQDEHEFFITRDESGDPFFDDFVLELEYVMWKRLGDDRLGAICKGLAALQIQASKMRMELTPIREAAAVTGLVDALWKTKADFISGLRIPVSSKRQPGKTLRVGEMVGKVFIVWWDSNRSIVYLQVEGLEKTLFSVGSYYRLGQLFDDDAFYGEVYRGTQHLLVLIPFLFDVLGYLPDLMSGWLTGLIKSVAFDMAFEKVVSATSINAEVAQLIVMGAGLLHTEHGPSKSSGHVEPVRIRARSHGPPHV
jgi:hypothetical protein